MPVLSSSTTIAAPQRLVAGVVRDGVAAAEALTLAGHRYEASVRLLIPGDEVLLEARIGPGVRLPYRSRIRSVGPEGMVSELAGGFARSLVHTTTLRPSGRGTVLRDEIAWTSPLGPLGRVGDAVVVRRLIRRMLAARAVVYRRRSEALVAAPVVVGAAIVRPGATAGSSADAAVLAAQRDRPPELAGRWELPGGSVEAGESEPEAVARECREELGAAVRIGERVGTDLPITVRGTDRVLRVHAATLVAGSAEPQALEHRAVRWLTAREIPTIGWVEADRAVVPDLRGLVGG